MHIHPAAAALAPICTLLSIASLSAIAVLPCTPDGYQRMAEAAVAGWALGACALIAFGAGLLVGRPATQRGARRRQGPAAGR